MHETGATLLKGDVLWMGESRQKEGSGIHQAGR